MRRWIVIAQFALGWAACWTSTTKSDETSRITSPPPAAPARRKPPGIELDHEPEPDAALTRAAPSPRPQAVLDVLLATKLHAVGSTVLASLVTGPVVVLDLKAGSFTTLCGPAAAQAAGAWANKLQDPRRGAPTCYVAPNRRCQQVDTPDLLVIELGDGPTPRVLGVVVGPRFDDPAFKANIRLTNQLGVRIAGARCP
jgi:hypothetical protein